VAWKENREIGDVLDREALERLSYVRHHDESSGTALIDAQLAALGIEPRVALTTLSFALVPLLLPGTQFLRHVRAAIDEAAREHRGVLDRLGSTLSEKRRHGMRRAAEQSNRATDPPRQRIPLEHRPSTRTRSSPDEAAQARVPPREPGYHVLHSPLRAPRLHRPVRFGHVGNDIDQRAARDRVMHHVTAWTYPQGLHHARRVSGRRSRYSPDGPQLGCLLVDTRASTGPLEECGRGESASRDPCRFTDPNSFGLGRRRNPHPDLRVLYRERARHPAVTHDGASGTPFNDRGARTAAHCDHFREHHR
jgi:hypothetical protein